VIQTLSVTEVLMDGKASVGDLVALTPTSTFYRVLAIVDTKMIEALPGNVGGRCAVPTYRLRTTYVIETVGGKDDGQRSHSHLEGVCWRKAQVTA
jgi:hypothetical protein